MPADTTHPGPAAGEPAGAAATGESPRQAEILDRVLELVLEGGLSSLTIRRIAERVGFSEAALYRHFPGKRALILALMDRLEALLLDPIRSLAADRSRPVPDRIEAVLRHHVDVVLRHRSLPILLLAEAASSGDPELLERMRGLLRSYLGTLKTLLREGQESGTLVGEPGADCLATLLVGAPAALAIRHRLMPDPDAERRYLDVLVPFLTGALQRPARDEGRPR